MHRPLPMIVNIHLRWITRPGMGIHFGFLNQNHVKIIQYGIVVENTKDEGVIKGLFYVILYQLSF